MGITQQSAAARLIQPGVIANASERPASPYEGQCIFQKDTDQLLVWNGTAWVVPNAPAQNPTGLELIETRNASGATVSFFNKLSSTYRNYKILITTNSNSTSADILMQMANGTTPVGGSSYSSSGYRQDYANAGGITLQTDINVAYFIVGRVDSAGGPGTADINLFNPFESVVTSISSQFIDARFVGHRLGRLNNTTSYSGFELTLSSSWSGNISLYGCRY